LDLECFTRALRLRWLWFRWKYAERPWTGLDVPCDKTDRELFHASTVITVGRGNKTTFWHSNWIHGQAPKHIAPTLFQKVKKKNITGSKAIRQNKWISHVSPIRSVEELHEFIVLWEGVNSVNRVEDDEDEISWRWTANGHYTTQSAYQIQCMGRQKTRPSPRFGRHKQNLNAKFLLGSYYSIKSSLPITWPSGDGRTTRCVSYVMRHRKRRHTYASIARSLKMSRCF
jgi:hypothetical protein